MTQKNRLPEGGRIDRSRPLGFLFNGRRYAGFSGDTLASALLANDVHFVGRSFKYHRKRGIVGSGAEEPNALVQLELGGRTEPNARATQVDLYEGLIASSQCGALMKYSSAGDIGTSSTRNGITCSPRATARSTSRRTCGDALELDV